MNKLLPAVKKLYQMRRELWDIGETNSILEIRLTLYCQIFEEMNSSYFTVAKFLSLRAVTFLILM
jgi:uncharacterized Rmd1/YagE family protein